MNSIYIVKKLLSILCLFFCFIILSSCNSSRGELKRDELIYNSEFENGNLDALDGATLMNFNNNTVIGNYNNDGFTIHLNDIGSHDYIFVSFDLYIHDSWDGNFNNIEPDQPDAWYIELRPEIDSFANTPNLIYETTFSNSVCNAVYCLRQSYPNGFPFENRPRKGASLLLPGLCSLASDANGTSMYRIEKGFEHHGNALILRFYDKLYQPNALNGDEKCDESWSLGNLKIRVISF